MWEAKSEWNFKRNVLRRIQLHPSMSSQASYHGIHHIPGFYTTELIFTISESLFSSSTIKCSSIKKNMAVSAKKLEIYCNFKCTKWLLTVDINLSTEIYFMACFLIRDFLDPLFCNSRWKQKSKPSSLTAKQALDKIKTTTVYSFLFSQTPLNVGLIPFHKRECWDCLTGALSCCSLLPVCFAWESHLRTSSPPAGAFKRCVSESQPLL